MEMAGDDHGSAVQERLSFHRCPPKHMLSEPRRAFRRIELMSNGGMDSVGANKNVPLVDFLRPRLTVGEADFYAVPILLKSGQLQPALDIFFADALADGVEQEKLKLAAMDRILWPAVTSCEASALAMDELAELVAKIQPARGDADFRKCAAESKLGEFANRGRLEIDADTERCGGAHGLVNTNRYASLMQAKRQAQPADAASRDDDVEISHLSLHANRLNLRAPEVIDAGRS
jgi:hypothetical protein